MKKRLLSIVLSIFILTGAISVSTVADGTDSPQYVVKFTQDVINSSKLLTLNVAIDYLRHTTYNHIITKMRIDNI